MNKNELLHAIAKEANVSLIDAKKCLNAFIITQNNQNIAVEAERTIKSKYRYQQIIVQYLKMIKANQIAKVRYVMPDQKLKWLRKLEDR